MAYRFTKAHFARHVSRIVRRSTLEAGGLAEGMHNPHFCDADACQDAKRLCEELRQELDHIENLCMKAEAAAQ